MPPGELAICIDDNSRRFGPLDQTSGRRMPALHRGQQKENIFTEINVMAVSQAVLTFPMTAVTEKRARGMRALRSDGGN